MTVEAGEWYRQADDHRTTEIYYDGKTYRITENYWESESGTKWSVSLRPTRAPVGTPAEIMERRQDEINLIKLLCAMGYELHSVEDGTTSIWDKHLDEPKP